MNLMRILKNLIFLSLLAGASVAGFKYWETSIKPYESTENTYLKAHMSLISPRESGYVKSVHFENNQTVNAGDLLVTIDDASKAWRPTNSLRKATSMPNMPTSRALKLTWIGRSRI